MKKLILSLMFMVPLFAVEVVTPNTLYWMIENDAKTFHLVDIREKCQTQRGEIFYVDSCTIPRGYLEFDMPKCVPDKNKTIVLYCCTGKRSELAAETLEKMGYTDVYSLEGGTKAWVNDGKPLTTEFGDLYIKED